MLDSAIRRRALLLGIVTVIAVVSAVAAGATSPANVAVGSSDLLGAMSAMPDPGGREEPTWIEGEVLVRLKTFVSADEAWVQAAAGGFRSLNAALGANVLEAIPVSDTAQVHRVKIPATISVEEAVIRYESSPFVEYAEPNYVWHTCATIPNDDYFLLRRFAQHGRSASHAALVPRPAGRCRYRCAGSLGHPNRRIERDRVRDRPGHTVFPS